MYIVYCICMNQEIDRNRLFDKLFFVGLDIFWGNLALTV